MYFNGNVQVLNFAVDARLLGRACVWATNASKARNEHFNIDNGDVFLMENVFKRVAEFFNVPYGGPKPMKLEPVSTTVTNSVKGTNSEADCEKYIKAASKTIDDMDKAKKKIKRAARQLESEEPGGKYTQHLPSLKSLLKDLDKWDTELEEQVSCKELVRKGNLKEIKQRLNMMVKKVNGGMNVLKVMEEGM